MKKTLLALVLISSILLAVSCATTGRVTDDTLRGIYGKYQSRLILDGAQKYIVKSGDQLVSISREFYGDGLYYPVIMLASRDVVLDPDLIQPGMELTIPDLQKNLSDPAAKAAIKGVIFEFSGVENSRGRRYNVTPMRTLANEL